MIQRLQIGAPAVVLALALARIAVGDPGAVDLASPARRVTPDPAPSPAPRIPGIEVGDALEGLTVARIAADDDEIVIELADGARGARVWVRGEGADARVMFGPPTPGLEAVSSSEGAALALAVRERLASE